MPVSVSTPGLMSAASTLRLSGGVESSLILNRAAKSASELATGSTGYTPGSADTAVLALELKRHERKRQLMRLRYSGPGKDEDEGEGTKAGAEDDVRRRLETRERLRRTGSDKENASEVRFRKKTFTAFTFA